MGGCTATATTTEGWQAVEAWPAQGTNTTGSSAARDRRKQCFCVACGGSGSIYPTPGWERFWSALRTADGDYEICAVQSDTPNLGKEYSHHAGMGWPVGQSNVTLFVFVSLVRVLRLGASDDAPIALTGPQ